MSSTVSPAILSQAVVDKAMQWIGVPYLYGGGRGSAASARLNGVDCSGLVYQVFTALGINPGGDTVSQMNNPAAQAIPDLASAQAGDLVFFGKPTGGTQEHVGIYIGGGMMIDAPHTGTTVGVHAVSGYGPILGIRRLTGGIANAGLPDGSATGYADTSTTSTDSTSSTVTGASNTFARLSVAIVGVALALSLVGLGIHSGIKQSKKKGPAPT